MKAINSIRFRPKEGQETEALQLGQKFLEQNRSGTEHSMIFHIDNAEYVYVNIWANIEAADSTCQRNKLVML